MTGSSGSRTKAGSSKGTCRGVPPTITGLLEARLDRLSSEERAVIGRASVEGRVFHWGSVTALSSDLPSDEVSRHLRSLVRGAT